MDRTKQLPPVVLALTAIFFWSTVATAFKLSLAHLSFLELVFWSSIVSVITFGIIITFKRCWADTLALLRNNFIWLLIGGILNPLLYYIVLFRAYSLLPAQMAQPLNYTWPVVLTIFAAIFLKQKAGLRDWLGLIVSFMGVAIISFKGDFTQMPEASSEGILLASGSALIWASYWIIGKKTKGDTLAILFWNFAMASPLLFLVLLYKGELIIPSWQGIAGSIYTGLFEMGITFLLWGMALKRSNNTARISNLVFLSPFISLIWIFFILKENILMSTIAGLLMIVGGILIQRLKVKK